MKSNTSNTATKMDTIIIKSTKIIALIALVVLIIYGGIKGYQLLQYESTNDAQVEQYVNPINVKVGGFIQKIYFDENQLVNEGDTLLVIDNRDFKVVQEQATATVENAAAQIDVYDSNIATLKSNAEVAKAQIDAAKAKMKRQEQEYRRFENLLKEESTTQQQFDNVKTGLDIANSDYLAAQNSYQAALSKINDAAAQKKVAQTEVKRTKYNLEMHDLNMDYTVVKAPCKGRIGKRIIQEGQLLQAGQTISFIVNESKGKWIVANFKETQIGAFKIGQKAKITVDAYPNIEFEGEIESVSPATGSRYSLLPPDNSTGNFVKIIQRIPVRIKLTSDLVTTQLLAAGMNANVYIDKR